MSRLGISYYKLRLHLDNPVKEPTFKLKKIIVSGKYKKLHPRARDHIVDLLMTAKYPVQLSDIQASVLKYTQLRCTKQMIRRFLKEELMMSYKLVRQITPLHNTLSSKL